MRHHEDAAHIIRSIERLPAIDQSALDRASDMLREKDIAALPSENEPALLLVDSARRALIERASEPMFWSHRIPLGHPRGSARLATAIAWTCAALRSPASWGRSPYPPR